MATNRVFRQGEVTLELAPTNAPNDPAETKDPVLVGEIPAVALTTAGDTIANSGKATIQRDGVFDLAVVGTSDDGTTGAAVSAGDIVYYDTALDQLSVNTSGTRFGYALADVASGATTTIRVQVGY